MWVCYKYCSKNKNKKWSKKGEIDLPKDCYGDELYDYMEENDIIKDIENYSIDGCDKVVAVIGKTKLAGNFYWRYYTIYIPEE
jgi:hypothetical protein